MLLSLVESYRQLAGDFYASADPRNSQYWLMYSWWPTFLMCLAYVGLVLRGQVWMRRQPAWELRRAMILYNAVMVLWSAYLVYEFLAAGWWSDLSFGCEVVTPTWEEKPLRMLRAGYLYYVTKLVEMLDTAFFVLRKRNNLITFLHVFHHAAMPASVWFGIKFAPGGSGSLYALINSLVHVFMYAYYGLAAAGPAYSRFLWWKPIMTIIQMGQFIIFIVFYHQFIVTPCAYPFHFCLAIYVYAWIFLVLFSNYFLQENLRQFRRRRQAKKLDAGDAADKSVVANGNSISHNDLKQANGSKARRFENGSVERTNGDAAVHRRVPQD